MKKKTMLKKAMRLAKPMMAPKPGPFAAAAGWAGEHLGGPLGERLMPSRRRSVGKGAAYGLGAAALAIPIGVWVGRRVRGGGVG